MQEKEEIEAHFYQDQYFYADMIAALRDGRNRVAYAEEDGVLLRMRAGYMHWLTAKTPEAAERILDFTKHPDMFLIHQDFARRSSPGDSVFVRRCAAGRAPTLERSRCRSFCRRAWNSGTFA